jgi:hypothetical protein
MEMGMSMDRSPRLRRSRSLLLVIAAAMLLAVGVASASAASSIEGVWSFGGGQIAVQPSAGGTFEATVVAQTKFAECIHPVGQKIWTGMTLQPDGSYLGFHQWYFESTCTLNPELGRTAWRVLEAADESHYLRACFSNPAPNAPQPTIAVNGTCVGASYGGVSSALTAPLPVVSSKTGEPTKESLSLPRAKKCLSARLFQIHLQDPKYDPFKKVSITFEGRKIATARKGKYIVATINLKGLPKGVFTVKIKATTVLGHSLSANRVYHTCVKKRSSSSKRSH